MPKRIMSYAAIGLTVLSVGKAGDILARTDEAPVGAARHAAGEFGTHNRPWARDLLAEAEAKDSEQDAGRSSNSDPQTCTFLDTLDSAIAQAYVEPIQTMKALDRERTRLADEALRVKEARALAEATIIRAEQDTERLAALRQEITGLLTTLESEAEADIERMRSLYETMKPKAAAEILKSMDVQTIVQVLERMPDRRAAPILSGLPIDLARDIMQVFAERRQPAAM